MKDSDAYILKKDTPYHKAGVEFLLDNERYLVPKKPNLHGSYFIESISDFDEWFEKKEIRWRPKTGDKYFYLSATLDVSENQYHEDCNYDIEIAAIGNCFRSINQCVNARKEVIKKLSELHEEWGGINESNYSHQETERY